VSRKPDSFVELERATSATSAQAAQAASRNAPAAAAARRHVALVVCHGMGQQVPFETIDALARMLRRAHLALAGNARAPDVTARVVDLGIGKPVGRAELTLSDAHGGEVRVHVYEAYWAPLTAGKVSLRQVIAFLLDAGLGGLAAARHTFLRWMFGGWQEFARSYRAFAELAVAILFVLSLVLANATIVTVAASRGIGHAAAQWPSAKLVGAITADFVLVLASWGLAALALGFAYACHQSIDENRVGWDRDAWPVRTLVLATNVCVWLAIVGTIVIAGLLGLDLYRDAVGAPLAWEGLCARGGAICALTALPGPALLAVWALVLLASARIRTFLVEFPGDVVAYVNAHAVSEFSELRAAIQRVAHDIAAAVYALRSDDGSGAMYSRVVLAGHSLGSVVAYDTLNRLLLEEAWHPGSEVRARTSALITFGSPLDKTAFVFRSQKPFAAEVREALAAGLQPLIADSLYRGTLTWRNFWSRADWLSGSLAYYDPNPPVAAWQVQNVRDDYASIPLLAHVMYWRSPQLARALYDAVTA
jgi:hypothetical protein